MYHHRATTQLTCDLFLEYFTPGHFDPVYVLYELCLPNTRKFSFYSIFAISGTLSSQIGTGNVELKKEIVRKRPDTKIVSNRLFNCEALPGRSRTQTRQVAGSRSPDCAGGGFYMFVGRGWSG